MKLSIEKKKNENNIVSMNYERGTDSLYSCEA